MGLLEKIRRWLDGEEAETALEDAIREAEKNPKSAAEDFIVRVARAVEEVMRREVIRLPQGSVLIPSEYIIFISEEDDQEWRGVKRRGLEESLYYILGQRAKEIAAGKELKIKKLSLELRVDGTLSKGEIRVQHTWDDGSSGITSVFSRQRQVSALPQSKDVEKPRPIAHHIPQPPPQFAPQPTIQSTPNPPVMSEPPKTTILKDAQPTDVPPTIISATPDEGEEATRIVNKITEFYKLEIWHNGIRQNVIPIYKPEVVIGRGSKSKPVDIALQGDLEISRHHLKLIWEAGNIYAVSEGRNPTFIENQLIPAGQKILIRPGMTIKVCSYLLKIQSPRV